MACEGVAVERRHEQAETVLLDEIMQPGQVRFGEGGRDIHRRAFSSPIHRAHDDIKSSKPKRGRDGRWNPPTAILDEFYKLMALRDTASKSDYTLETICALYIRELASWTPFR